MTSSRVLRVGLGVCVAAVFFTWSQRTRACTAPCREQLRAPTGSVPANALAIPLFDPGTAVEVVGPDGPITLNLTTTAAGNVLRPATDLTDGARYTLSYDNKCQGKRIDVFFGATAPAAAPTALGKVFVVSAGIEGSSMVFVRTSLTLDPAVSPFYGLIDLHTEVDGLPVSDFNVVGSYETVTLTTTCPPDGRTLPVRDSCGGVTSVAAGAHQVSIVATLAGAEDVLPVASTTVNLDCAWLDSVRPTPAAKTGDAQTAPTGDAGGCGLAAGASGQRSAGWLAVAALGAAFWISRRARRGT